VIQNSFNECWNGVQVLDCKGIYLFFEVEISTNQFHGINISDHLVEKEEEKHENNQTRTSTQNTKLKNTEANSNNAIKHHKSESHLIMEELEKQDKIYISKCYI
jgi:hypothetical protein